MPPLCDVLALDAMEVGCCLFVRGRPVVRAALALLRNELELEAGVAGCDVAVG